MHLKDRPTYFTKEGAVKAVYYSVDARQLADAGWVLADELNEEARKEEELALEEELDIEDELITEEAQPEVEEEKTDEVDRSKLEGMTKSELIEFASQNNIEIDPYGLKSEVLDACIKYLENA